MIFNVSWAYSGGKEGDSGAETVRNYLLLGEFG
jgi:hypothetical protein